jgi:dienelactone hydrolase
MTGAIKSETLVSLLTLLFATALAGAQASGADPAPSSTKPAASPASVAASGPASHAASQPSGLATDRKGFITKLLPGKSPLARGGGKADVPPAASQYSLIRYKSPAGNLVAYLSVPKDTKKHPAVIWAHGGYGGIGAYHCTPQPAEDDQTPKAFKDAGFVVMMPTWRGENDNLGRFEMFYGEIDDALAAIDYVSKLPSVDPSRIYIVGHSTGGTVTLLTALSSTKLRAAFSLGGCPDVAYLPVIDPKGHPAAWDPAKNQEEGRLRSAINFVETLKTPMWYFEGSESWYSQSSLQMDRKGQAAEAPFHAFLMDGADHCNLVRPVTQLLAAKIAKDDGPACNIQITAAEVEDAYRTVFAGKSIKAITAGRVALSMTPAGHDAVAGLLKAKAPDGALDLVMKGGEIEVMYRTEVRPTNYMVECDVLKVTIADEVAAKWDSILIDVEEHDKSRSIVAKPLPKTTTQATTRP